MGVARGLCAAAAAAALLAAAARADAPAVPELPGRAQLAQDRQLFLRTADQGMALARRDWWNAELGWYDERLTDNWREPLLMAWSAYQLLEAVNGLAAASPTPARRRAVRAVADRAETYFNPALRPVGAYAYYPGKRDPSMPYYFDDSGWFGLGFLDAYQVTGVRRYLRDAERAFRFLDVSGWAANDGGGFWWETGHKHKTSEPLAAGILMGARLYAYTKKRAYLEKARRWLAWANAHSWNAARGLYQRSETDDVVMSYVEGPMAEANERLCRITRVRSYCSRAELVARNSVIAFSVDLHWAPTYDAVYLRSLLRLYALDHDPTWYALAYHNAQRALRDGRDMEGRFLLGWDGAQLTGLDDVRPGQLSTHAATVSLLAWLAAAPLP